MAFTGEPGTYAVAGIVVAGAQAEIIVHLNTIKALIGGNAADGGHTDGDRIPGDLRDRIRAELDALGVGIDAAPVA